MHIDDTMGIDYAFMSLHEWNSGADRRKFMVTMGFNPKHVVFLITENGSAQRVNYLQKTHIE